MAGQWTKDFLAVCCRGLLGQRTTAHPYQQIGNTCRTASPRKSRWVCAYSCVCVCVEAGVCGLVCYRGLQWKNFPCGSPAFFVTWQKNPITEYNLPIKRKHKGLWYILTHLWCYGQDDISDNNSSYSASRSDSIWINSKTPFKAKTRTTRVVLMGSFKDVDMLIIFKLHAKDKFVQIRVQ